MLKQNVFRSLLLTFSLVCINCASAPSYVHAQDDSQKLIPSSAMAALFAKPMDALSQPGMELIPHEIITAFGEKEVGFDPCKIVNLVGMIDTFSDIQNPPNFGLLIEFDSPQEISDSLIEKMNMTKGDLRGKPIYRGTSEFGEVLFPFDEKTIIFANETFLSKMLASKGAQSGLLSQISQSPPKGHLDVYVAIEPVRGLIKQNLPPSDRIPPPFAPFLKLPDLVESLSSHSSFAENGVSKFQVNAIDAESADEIRKLIRSGIATAQQFIFGQMANEMADEDPVFVEALNKYVDRVGKYLQTNIKPDIDGNHLVFDFSNNQSAQLSNTATVGILVGMLLPAVQQVREAARRTQAANMLRQMALAAHNYADAHQHIPMQANYSDDGKALLSWRVHVLPYMEENELYAQFKLDEPWDSPHNIKLLDRMPEIFRGPNSVHTNKTVFLGISGPGTIFPGNKKIKFIDVKDGTSNTFMFVETNDDAAVPWTQPVDYELDRNDPEWGLIGVRNGGFQAAFVDGSVQFISEFTELETLVNLMLINDGNVIGDY